MHNKGKILFISCLDTKNCIVGNPRVITLRYSPFINHGSIHMKTVVLCLFHIWSVLSSYCNSITLLGYFRQLDWTDFEGYNMTSRCYMNQFSKILFLNLLHWKSKTVNGLRFIFSLNYFTFISTLHMVSFFPLWIAILLGKLGQTGNNFIWIFDTINPCKLFFFLIMHSIN